MDWFEVTNTDGEKILINASTIMSVRYNEKTNLTIIDFIRAAWASVYVNGDITLNVKRLLSSHDHYVSKIGG